MLLLKRELSLRVFMQIRQGKQKTASTTVHKNSLKEAFFVPTMQYATGQQMLMMAAQMLAKTTRPIPRGLEPEGGAPKALVLKQVFPPRGSVRLGFPFVQED